MTAKLHIKYDIHKRLFKNFPICKSINIQVDFTKFFLKMIQSTTNPPHTMLCIWMTIAIRLKMTKTNDFARTKSDTNN